MLLYDRNVIGFSSEIFGYLRISSAIFGKYSENVRKRSWNLRKNFGNFSAIFGKWSEIFGKSSKTTLLVALYNNRILHARLWICILSSRVQLDIYIYTLLRNLRVRSPYIYMSAGPRSSKQHESCRFEIKSTQPGSQIYVTTDRSLLVGLYCPHRVLAQRPKNPRRQYSLPRVYV